MSTQGKKILISGGAGFIGSAVIRFLINETHHNVLNLDKLTYAGNLASLSEIATNPRYQFVQGDIVDAVLVSKLFADFQPDIVMHLAAESHVDRSIDGPSAFIETNIVGTYAMLEVARSYWGQLEGEKKSRFKFHHISTDEVYGDILTGRSDEKYAYKPSSPYAASKASSDHLVYSYVRTHNIPAMVTNCSNNYGPKQHPEKLIPKLIYNILNNKALPIYGKGKNSREWIYVKDHCEALLKVFQNGKIGEFYNIGSNKNLNNIQICKTLLKISNKINVAKNNVKIKFVKDRPGHDFRYA